MKICHVNLARHFSGSERQTIHLIKQQLREGYQITVVARHNTPFAKEAEKLPCALITTRKLLPNHSAKLNKQCQLVHAHDEHAAKWSLNQHSFYRTPYIITRRTTQAFSNKNVSIKAYKKAGALVGLSSAIVTTLENQFPDKACYRIPSSGIAYPIDQNKVDQIWSSHGYKFLVMQATLMDQKKGVDVTLEAARMLQKKNMEVHFLLLGSGPQKQDLMQQAKDLNNVFFMSKQDDMGTWFASANLLVHPSQSEGLGAVILEAMVAGLPVVATNVGGIPDLIESEHTGLLIQPGDAQSLADAIERMAADQQLRQQLQANAKQKIKQFDITAATKHYHNVYQHVIQ